LAKKASVKEALKKDLNPTSLNFRKLKIERSFLEIRELMR
jgi:hypothetical protein